MKLNSFFSKIVGLEFGFFTGNVFCFIAAAYFYESALSAGVSYQEAGLASGYVLGCYLTLVLMVCCASNIIHLILGSFGPYKRDIKNAVVPIIAGVGIVFVTAFRFFWTS
jgi:hypothetical protein